MLRFEKNLVDYLVDDMNIKLKMINGKHDQHEQNGKSSSSSPSSLNSSFASNEDGQKSDYDDDSSVVIEKYDYPQKATVDYSETDDDTSDSEPMLEYKQLELRPLLKDTDTLQLEITIINTCTNFEAHLMENKHAKVCIGEKKIILKIDYNYKCILFELINAEAVSVLQGILCYSQGMGRKSSVPTTVEKYSSW